MSGDLLLTVASCAVVAGAIGLMTLRWLRGRSLRTRLIMAVAPIITSTTAGALGAVGTGLVSGRDSARVVELCIAAALVVLAMAALRVQHVSRELVAAESRLTRSRERERAEERSRRELLAKATLDIRAPLADLRALAMALEDGDATEPVACYARTLEVVDLLTRMADDLLELCGEPVSTRPEGTSGR
jgi:signal transduction histidine kinase